MSKEKTPNPIPKDEVINPTKDTVEKIINRATFLSEVYGTIVRFDDGKFQGSTWELRQRRRFLTIFIPKSNDHDYDMQLIYEDYINVNGKKDMFVIQTDIFVRSNNDEKPLKRSIDVFRVKNLKDEGEEVDTEEVGEMFDFDDDYCTVSEGEALAILKDLKNIRPGKNIPKSHF